MTCKVFVGNVPFQCDIDDFRNCFNHMDGFVRAELNHQYNNLSRGFGFVLFDTEENAKQLMSRTDIIFMNRQLRFNEYNFENKNEYCTHARNQNDLQEINYLFVKNLTDTITRDDLKNIFSQYGKVGKYFIISDHKTGILKNTGIVEIIDNNVYEYLLKKKYLYHSNTKFELCRWRYQRINKIHNLTK